MLNFNQYLKVEDSGFLLSCNAVNVLFQIKKGLSDLPNIVFSPFRGWKLLVLSLISLPCYPLLYTHSYNTNTHGCSVLWSVLLSSQRLTQGCEGQKIRIIAEKEAINVIL